MRNCGRSWKGMKKCRIAWKERLIWAFLNFVWKFMEFRRSENPLLEPSQKPPKPFTQFQVVRNVLGAMLRNNLLTAFTGQRNNGPTNDITRKIGLNFFIKYISHSQQADK